MDYAKPSNPAIHHNEWRRTLYFYEKELDLLNKRMKDVASKNKLPQVQKGISQYQQQVTLQYNKIEELKNAINVQAHLVFEEVNHVKTESNRYLSKDKKIGAEVQQLEKVLNDLRHEFNGSLLKWMQVK